MKKIKKIGIGIITFLLVSPIVVSAQLNPPNKGNSNLPDLTFGRGLNGAAEFIINTLLMVAGIIAVLFLIIGGFQYITSGGNDELAGQGKKTIQNAIIGIVIIILSYTLVTVIFRALAG